MQDSISVLGFTDPFVGFFLPLQLFLFQLQLQHDSTQLHVQVVSSLQFPLVVLTDIQSMPERKNPVNKTAVDSPSCGFTYI